MIERSMQQQFSQQPSNSTTRGSKLVYNVNTVLARQTLTNVAGTVIFTVPAQVVYVMTNFSLFNSSPTVVATVTLRLVASDGVNDATSDYWSKPMRARGREYETVEEVLSPGYQIVAFADQAGLVNIKINGVNLVQQ